MAAYAAVTQTLPDKETTALEMRALVLSRFPSVLLVIAMAWWFPSNFYAVIALYTTSTSFAAVRSLPGIESNTQAAFVAICAAIPRVVKALPPGTLKFVK